MPISLSGRLWAKRVVETSQEAYDAVVLHVGSWDATYTAYNASRFEEGQRAEVHTWQGAPRGLSEKGRITASQSSGSKMAEARPNLHWATCVRPAFLLASFLDVNHHATLPCEGFYRSPCRMDTSPLAAPNVPLCHPWYRLASCISRFRGMVSTLLSEWRKARVVSDAPSPALAIQNVCPFLLGRPFCSPFSPACLLFAQLV